MVAERENIQVTEEKELLQQRTQGSRNEMEIVFDAVSCNESFARVAVAAFITHLNPTLEELEPATKILCLCIKIATIEKMIAQASEQETAPQNAYAIAQ